MSYTVFTRNFLTVWFISVVLSCSYQAKEEMQKPLKDPNSGTVSGTAKQSSARPAILTKFSDNLELDVALEGFGNQGAFETEEYSFIKDNRFRDVLTSPLSTFSIDVDNASYANIRRFLTQQQLPPKDAVRIEEMINYFNYDYPQPVKDQPFSVNLELAGCPWNDAHQLVHIGLQGRQLDYKNLKPCNLVFLIDVSGSMSSPNKIELLKKVFKIMVNELTEKDRIAVVTYAGAAGLVLPSTPATEKDKIFSALEKLEAGGSTAGGEGIALAYAVAKKNLIKNGNNRVILATDGDFNVGVSSTGDLIRLIEEKRKDNIYLTICGFGMGNYKDSRMEEISNAGNGNYFYIDSFREGEKVFKRELRANLFTIAKDVKIQIEFNPIYVKSYRLIGYENRVLANEDFNDDKKDAGELGAGHTVTALYEIVPPKNDSHSLDVPALKYQATQVVKSDAANSELLTLKLRYKNPNEDQSQLTERILRSGDQRMEQASENFRFSAAVAGFGMLLRDSEYKGSTSFAQVLKMAKEAKGADPEGYRAECINLMETAARLSAAMSYNK